MASWLHRGKESQSSTCQTLLWMPTQEFVKIGDLSLQEHVESLTQRWNGSWEDLAQISAKGWKAAR